MVVVAQMEDPHWQISSVPAWVSTDGSSLPQGLRLDVHLQSLGLA